MSSESEVDERDAALAADIAKRAEELEFLLALEAKDVEKRSLTVGYGRPPIDSRYKKGTSGNPRGRPRKPERSYSLRQFSKDILRTTNEEIAIKTNGKTERVSIIELVLRKLRMEAAQGKLGATKLILALHQAALTENTKSNRRLHDLVESMEVEAVVNGHLPPDHHIFRQLDTWRRRTRR